MTAPRQFFKKRDAVILLLIVVGCLVCMALLRQTGDNLTLRISVDGEVVWQTPCKNLKNGTFSPLADADIALCYEDGAVCVASADCPDQSCVRMGWIDAPGEMIVCLPHRMLVELVRADPEKPEVDVIVG